MGCLIVSEDGNLYISVIQNGDITTSNKSYAKVFDEYKAKKLLKHLPKRLRKNGFSIQPIVKEKEAEESESETTEIEEIVIQEDCLELTTDDNDGDYLINENYEVPLNVLAWVNRVQEQNRFISDAASRYRDLEKALSVIDDQYQNITHHIEMDNSPTQNVGYTVAEDLEEVVHNHPMLSLDKTKSIDELRDFAGNRNCFLSVKCDGLTTSLYYSNGKLTGAETRGDGVRGVNVLQNVLTIKNIPHTIPYTDELIIDGETIIGWDSFRKINEPLPEDKKYKHPRNLVSGSLQLFNSAEAAERNMRL